MVKYASSRLDGVFHALSDPTRRAFVREVSGGPKSLGALAERSSVSLPLATKHLAVLQKAGLVSTTKDGRVRTCRFEPGAMQEANEWIRKYEHFWEAGLARMAEFMEAGWEAENDANG